MKDRKISVRHRDDVYAEKYATSIWFENPSDENPFVESDVCCYGYSLPELVDNVSITDMVLLLLKGELPSKEESQFLNRLMVTFSHPGIRNEATRASILGGVGKTIYENVLPIGLLVYGGKRTGVGEVASLMKFFYENNNVSIEAVVNKGEKIIGYKKYFGTKTILADKMADWLMSSDMSTPHLAWGKALDILVNTNDECCGWTKTAVAAAALCDLGIEPKFGVALMQYMAAPGLLAQAFEHAEKPPTVHPFVSDEDYELLMDEYKDE